MRHLRITGIDIHGSRQKRLLINTGYYHGYKGYRFFKEARNRIPFTNYEDIYSTIQYDSKLKSLLYGHIMFIETALKSIALDVILKAIDSDNLQDMYDKVVSSYKNCPSTSNQEYKEKLQRKKLALQNMIQREIGVAYNRENPKITHFYNNMNYNYVPLWAIFEVLSMGDFGTLLSCLNIVTRENISREIGLNLSSDTNRELIYKYVYAIKDLRNAIAHNDVIYDTRFRRIDSSKAMSKCLMNEFKISYANFKTIVDYIILVCYFLKLLHVPKTEIKSLIRDFEKITEEYKNSVNGAIASITVHNDLQIKLRALKSHI